MSAFEVPVPCPHGKDEQEQTMSERWAEAGRLAKELMALSYRERQARFCEIWKRDPQLSSMVWIDMLGISELASARELIEHREEQSVSAFEVPAPCPHGKDEQEHCEACEECEAPQQTSVDKLLQDARLRIIDLEYRVSCLETKLGSES